MHRRNFLTALAGTAGLGTVSGCSAADLPVDVEGLSQAGTTTRTRTAARTPTAEGTAGPVRLTSPDHAAARPTWSLDGRSLVYQRLKADPGSTGRAHDIGRVRADGSDDGGWITGPSSGFGVAGGPLHWIGADRLLTYEAVAFHEIMEIDTSLAPFERTVPDGDDEAFSRRLLVPGGGGALTHSLSADGSTLTWASRDPQGRYTVRVAPFDSLSGQDSATHGATLLGPSDDRLERGIATVFDGSGVVISRPTGSGYDLFLHDTDGGDEVARLTTSGETDGRWNITPALSWDAERVAYVTADGDGGPYHLVVTSLFGDEGSAVTQPGTIDVRSPAWSPDGSRLAFQGREPDNPDSAWGVYVTDPSRVRTTSPTPEGEDDAPRRAGPWISVLDAARFVEGKMAGEFEVFAVGGHVAMAAGDHDAGHHRSDEPSPAGGLALVWEVNAESEGENWTCGTDADSTNCRKAGWSRPEGTPGIVGLGVDSTDAYEHWLEDESFAAFTEDPANSLLLTVSGSTWKAVVTDHDGGGGGSWTWDPVQGIDEGSTY